MKLTAAAVKNAKASSKAVKIFDGHSMYLFVKPNGAKYWRLDYRIEGKYKTLGLGIFPDVSLAEARSRREEARQLISQGIDPSAQRKELRAAKIVKAQGNTNSFETLAREWLEKQSHLWVPSHADRNKRRLESFIFPLLGDKPITEITPSELLEALKRIEARGTIETAHRVKSLCDQVFDFAISTLRCTHNPAHPIRKALQKTKKKHFATITDPVEVGKLLRNIDSYKGFFVTQCALKLAPLFFLRPGELRSLRWDNINLDTGVITLPPSVMKMKRTHHVFISSQAKTILQDLQRFTGTKEFCFPGLRSSKRPMSGNALLGALRRLGYTTDEMCTHSFRSLASTLLNEQGWNRDVIEMALAHCPSSSNNVRAAYNHAQYIPERTRMAQAWADYLDALKAAE